MPTRHTPIRTSSLLLTLSLAAMPVLAADNPAAHQHGHADLQVAVDHERIDLALLSPAYNLIGFEHRPRTEAQRQRVQTVESWAVETPLITALGIDCTITSASMHASWGDTDDHDHGHQQHDDHAQSATHSDVEITQTLNCPGLSESSRLETSLMTHFPELEHLNVQWVGPQGQGATRLTPGNSQFRLSR